MKKLNSIPIFIFLLFNSLVFTDMLYADNNKSDGCIILNLHWSEGEITLNSLKKIVGLKKRAGRRTITQNFFYNILSEDGETVKAGYFKIPKKLHYDYFDESTGELKGGCLKPDEIDFVLRVPYLPKAKQISFYKKDRFLQQRVMNAKLLLETSDDNELLGTIDF